MRYDLGAEELAIFFGPFIRWRIPLGAIRTVQTENLTPSFRAGTRMPGLALFSVAYNGLGKVRMCSTKTIRDVVLLDTDRGFYGISPADPEGFIRELQRRMATARSHRSA